jgi:hypothetical protein
MVNARRVLHPLRPDLRPTRLRPTPATLIGTCEIVAPHADAAARSA